MTVQFVNFSKSWLIFNILYGFLNVCKQTFNISRVLKSQKVQCVLMWDLQHIIFIWQRRYCQIFKSALVTFMDFYFCTKLCILINSSKLISNLSIAFQTYCPKCLNKAFLVPNFLFVVVLNNSLHFGKFEDVDLKYNKSFSNLWAKIPK